MGYRMISMPETLQLSIYNVHSSTYGHFVFSVLVRQSRCLYYKTFCLYQYSRKKVPKGYYFHESILYINKITTNPIWFSFNALSGYCAKMGDYLSRVSDEGISHLVLVNISDKPSRLSWDLLKIPWRIDIALKAVLQVMFAASFISSNYGRNKCKYGTKNKILWTMNLGKSTLSHNVFRLRRLKFTLKF